MSQVVEAGVSDDQCVRMFVWVSVSPMSMMMMLMGACIADVSTFYIRMLLLCKTLYETGADFIKGDKKTHAKVLSFGS